MKSQHKTQLTMTEDIYDLAGRQQGTQGLTSPGTGIPELSELKQHTGQNARIMQLKCTLIFLFG